jgi:hypothetical protein
VLISGFAIYPVSHSNYGTHPLIAVMINLAIGSAHLRISLRIQQKSALSATAGQSGWPVCRSFASCGDHPAAAE